MLDPPLDVRHHLAGVAFVPVPIEVLGDVAELDDEISRQVLGFELAAFLPPQPQQGFFIGAHDDPGVRAADEEPPTNAVCRFRLLLRDPVFSL